MFEVKGKYNTAIVFSDSRNEKAVNQIIELCNQDFVSGAKIRIMPDYHFGAGCVIGFTANLGNKVVPNIVGVDASCGMLTVNLGKEKINLEELDNIIHENIPAGFNSHESPKIINEEINNLYCIEKLKKRYIFDKQIGTLGGGNHLIEIDIDNEKNQYLVIHSGSRNLGKQVVDYYQNVAIEHCKNLGNLQDKKLEIIKQLKHDGKQRLIQSALKKLEKTFRETNPIYPRNLCFLEGKDKEQYLHDMAICQRYATLNRDTMADIILKKLYNKLLHHFESFHTIHNYIDFKDNIIRKGAVSAYKNEKLIIPINMRDGCLLCTGKGNADWNYSAPHGAGRLMGRNEAKRKLNIKDFEKEMQGVYSTTVNENTLDEAPMAYKSMEEIINNIQDTVTVDKIIKPIYNFKSDQGNKYVKFNSRNMQSQKN